MRGMVLADRRLAQSSRRWLVISVVLTIFVLVSAFSIVYFKDLNRRIFIDYQSLQQQGQYEQVEWGKLMLEEGAWSTQAKIQTVAQTRLGMMLPRPNQIEMVALGNTSDQSKKGREMLAENDIASFSD